MSVVIKVENVSKQYRLGVLGTGSLIHDMNRWWARIKGKEDPYLRIGEENKRETRGSSPYVWALRISILKRTGEVMGIVGRNGSGKSTLLKILSRVTAPTMGQVKVKGRIASLLEVGTGFHPELTGKENIFLNGAILGMSRAEIKSKMDEIIDFAGVERYIDTPVKRYSSGMFVRLAFAVAAHLEPEILVIDEVLAVGDLAFQKKCIGKMNNVASQGRTVLFVSHNMQSVRSLCSTSILLQNGNLLEKGPTEDILASYNKSLMSSEFGDDDLGKMIDHRRRWGNGAVRFTRIMVTDQNGSPTNIFDINGKIRIKVEFKANENLEEVYLAIMLKSGMNREIITNVWHRFPGGRVRKGGTYSMEIVMDDHNLRPGEYPLRFWLGSDLRVLDYDGLDDATHPIIITSNQTFEELGYNPGQHSGYFSIRSRVMEEETVY